MSVDFPYDSDTIHGARDAKTDYALATGPINNGNEKHYVVEFPVQLQKNVLLLLADMPAKGKGKDKGKGKGKGKDKGKGKGKGTKGKGKGKGKGN